MAEALGVAGTVLAFVGLLYSTCKTVSDIIDQYEKAPKEYKDLAQDLRGLQTTLDSLQKALCGIDDESLSSEQRSSLTDLELPLKTCTTACDDFKDKLTKMTSRSTEDHTATWDRLRLHFNKSDITFLREKLNTTKGTLQIALSVSTLRTMAQSQTKLNEFQESTASTMSELSGRVEGLKMSIDALSLSGVKFAAEDVEVVKLALDEHGKLLKQCLLCCTSALGAANAAVPGTQVRHAKALDHARQVIGNLGALRGDAPTVAVDTAEAGGSAFQGIGNVDIGSLSKDALDFLAGK